MAGTPKDGRSDAGRQSHEGSIGGTCHNLFNEPPIMKHLGCFQICATPLLPPTQITCKEANETGKHPGSAGSSGGAAAKCCLDQSEGSTQ